MTLYGTGRTVAVSCLLLCVASSCGRTDHVRANAPPQGSAPSHPVITEVFAYQLDNAMLADAAIADIHFVPRTTDLSGAGEARLARYAELLAESGGTVYYDTRETDQALIDGRIAAVKRFLADAVPGARAVAVAVGPPQGRGIDSDEAMAGRTIAQEPEPRRTGYRFTR